MIRPLLLCALLLAGCAGPPPAPPAPSAPEGAAAVPMRILNCGGESFRIGFTATEARVAGPDGDRVLSRLSGEGDGRTYTDGRMTFTLGAAGAPIRFARGRMAFQDCAEAQIQPPIAAPAAEPASCADERGAATAAALVERCLRVSPATRPPCDAANACALIEGEITRGCGLLGADAPAGDCG